MQSQLHVRARRISEISCSIQLKIGHSCQSFGFNDSSVLERVKYEYSRMSGLWLTIVVAIHCNRGL